MHCHLPTWLNQSQRQLRDTQNSRSMSSPYQRKNLFNTSLSIINRIKSNFKMLCWRREEKIRSWILGSDVLFNKTLIQILTNLNWDISYQLTQNLKSSKTNIINLFNLKVFRIKIYLKFYKYWLIWWKNQKVRDRISLQTKALIKISRT